jgi:hypothetical protein
MTLAEFAIANTAGLVVGTAASFSAWWLVFHWIIPKVEFSSGISSVPRRSDSLRRSYRIKFANTGKRAMVGVEAFARLRIKWDSSGNWTGYYLPFNSDGDRKYDVPRLERGANRILHLWINQVRAFRTANRFPMEIRAKAKQKQLTLEDLLSLGVTATVQMFVSGYDEFSGARKVFASPVYALTDIRCGRFRGLSVVESQSENAERKNGDDQDGAAAA